MNHADKAPHPLPAPPGGSERGFWHLVGLQFQGAFSDNAYRICLMMAAAAILTDPNDLGKYTSILQMLFPIAFLACSVWAGFLADKYSKRTITLATKLSEIGIMGLALTTFLIAGTGERPGAAALVLPTIIAFLMFTQSAIFSPSKYGIIPELVREQRLGWANGVVGLTTYVAIILGLSAGTGLYALLKPDRLAWIPLLLAGLAAVGYLIGQRIDRTPPANPTRPVWTDPLPELKGYFRTLFSDRTLALTVIGLAYFWGLGALLLSHTVVWGKHSLGMSEEGGALLYLVMAFGIGAGSGLASAFSRRRIETGLIPLGAVGLAVFAFPLAFAHPGNRVWMAASLLLLGASGGLFTVPLNALLQQRTDPRDRGGLLAANNYVTNAAILLSALIYYLLNELDVSANGVFIPITIVTLIGTFVTIRLTPEIFVRFIAFLLTHTLYRIRARGAEHVPERGPALIVSNHVSFVDALLVMAVIPRPVRFVAHESLFRKRFVGLFLRATRSIPVGSGQRPRELMRSLKAAGGALAEGELVCIFAEGQITRTGQLLPFRRGYERILKHHPSPIVPVCLHGVWGSIFSFERGKFFWKRPYRVPYPIHAVIGAPLAADAAPSAVRAAIQELGAEAAIAGRGDRTLLHHGLIQAARRHWGLFAMVDTMSPPLTLGRSLVGGIILARRLAPEWGGQQTVGILLPPSIGGALVNYAATLSGRTAVNLNYTLTQEGIDHCARQAGIETVVTSRKFLEKAELKPPGRAIHLEDHRGDPTLGQKLGALCVARVFPKRWVERYCKAVRRPGPDTTGTIIFSSGSTGRPKGIVLSHFNIVSNIESWSQSLTCYPNDRLLGALPFFHSFGYTVALWSSASRPFGCVYHHNPLDLRTIGELCAEHKVTLIITTPTFLQAYLRRVPPEAFGGVNCVVTGAEKLPDRLAQAFLERFGIEPLQGYGTTECSPIVAVNVDDHRSPGFYQVGHKRGSVGHALPGVVVRTVDTDTGEPLPQGEPGLLQVKGPNVMEGYLDMPEKTAEALRDGWYDTGDVAYIDEDGFIFITDRLSRFSKIGGEMVPHVTVQDKMHELMGWEDSRLVVTAVPDEKKGEQLVVLHTMEESELATLLERLPGAGLPNIFLPRREMFFPIDEIPVLGTGKLDLKGVKARALELTGQG